MLYDFVTLKFSVKMLLMKETVNIEQLRIICVNTFHVTANFEKKTYKTNRCSLS